MIHLPHADSHGHEQHNGLHDLMPDLTPMLDILFILLVFFMLTTGAILQSLGLALPSSVAEDLPTVDAQKHIMIAIRSDGYKIDNKSLSEFSQLREQLPSILDAKPEHQIIVAGDKHISIERLLEVLTYLQSQGIAVANILLQHEKQI